MIRIDLIQQNSNHPGRRMRHPSRASCEVGGRREGFADPVDALLALAYETDDAGEWKHPIEIRIQCLLGAAPFVRPKLQAIVAKLQGGTKSHADWLRELKEEMEDGDNEIIEGNGKARLQ